MSKFTPEQKKSMEEILDVYEFYLEFVSSDEMAVKLTEIYFFNSTTQEVFCDTETTD